MPVARGTVDRQAGDQGEGAVLLGGAAAERVGRQRAEDRLKHLCIAAPVPALEMLERDLGRWLPARVQAQAAHSLGNGGVDAVQHSGGGDAGIPVTDDALLDEQLEATGAALKAIR